MTAYNRKNTEGDEENVIIAGWKSEKKSGSLVRKN